MTALSALVAMIVGSVTVLIWSNIDGGIFDLYEIVPGFVLASITIVTISLLKPMSNQQVLQGFKAVEELISR